MNVAGATTSVYSFLPVDSDVRCDLRAIVTTLGLSVTSAVVRVTIPPIELQVRREGTNMVISWVGPGTLQNAVVVTGPWVNAGGVTNNSVLVRPISARRYYRVRL